MTPPPELIKGSPLTISLPDLGEQLELRYVSGSPPSSAPHSGKRSIARVHEDGPRSQLRPKERYLQTPHMQEKQASEFAANSDIVNILFLAINPLDEENKLRLNEEERSIQDALRKAEYRDRFNFQQRQAVRVSELQECFLQYHPHIVHFSGHGSKNGELCLEDETGNSQPVSVKALGGLFAILEDRIVCVVLNACYSDQQAEEIARHIDYVIGMSATIRDTAAIIFAKAFYQALGYGMDVKTAFHLACTELELESSPDADKPQLFRKAGPGTVFFTSRGKESTP
ncbi:MAG: CHAT domain-containing protein [Anaerolineae bacterium]|nr:CHAT domain-containing protein [Anaerolineae bacterium]